MRSIQEQEVCVLKSPNEREYGEMFLFSIALFPPSLIIYHIKSNIQARERQRARASTLALFTFFKMAYISDSARTQILCSGPFIYSKIMIIGLIQWSRSCCRWQDHRYRESELLKSRENVCGSGSFKVTNSLYSVK